MAKKQGNIPYTTELLATFVELYRRDLLTMSPFAIALKWGPVYSLLLSYMRSHPIESVSQAVQVGNEINKRRKEAYLNSTLGKTMLYVKDTPKRIERAVILNTPSETEGVGIGHFFKTIMPKSTMPGITPLLPVDNILTRVVDNVLPGPSYYRNPAKYALLDLTDVKIKRLLGDVGDIYGDEGFTLPLLEALDDQVRALIAENKMSNLGEYFVDHPNDTLHMTLNPTVYKRNKAYRDKWGLNTATYGAVADQLADKLVNPALNMEYTLGGAGVNLYKNGYTVNDIYDFNKGSGTYTGYNGAYENFRRFMGEHGSLNTQSNDPKIKFSISREWNHAPNESYKFGGNLFPDGGEMTRVRRADGSYAYVKTKDGHAITDGTGKYNLYDANGKVIGSASGSSFPYTDSGLNFDADEKRIQLYLGDYEEPVVTPQGVTSSLEPIFMPSDIDNFMLLFQPKLLMGRENINNIELSPVDYQRLEDIAQDLQDKISESIGSFGGSINDYMQDTFEKMRADLHDASEWHLQLHINNLYKLYEDGQLSYGDLIEKIYLAERLQEEEIERINSSIYNNPDYFEYNYAKGGSIHINPKNKGKFSAAAKRAGMSTQLYASHVLANKNRYSSTLVKRANFARNASKWKHSSGGPLIYAGHKGYARI